MLGLGRRGGGGDPGTTIAMKRKRHLPTSPPAAAAGELIAAALAEDLGPGDVTSAYFIAAASAGTAQIVAKEEGIVAGVEVAAAVFGRVDAALRVEVVVAGGRPVVARETVIRVAGAVRSILAAERVALNFLGRLSGIATQTWSFVEAVSGTGAKILDTRKTTPGWRALEKAAVVAGGGRNHRFGLYDAVLVKDNHLAAVGGWQEFAAKLARLKAERPELRVEVEADHLEQVRALVGMPGVDVILLDNMTPAMMREAVALGCGRVQFEASGGVSIATVRAIAETGVDFISVGAITHSAPALDYSLELLPADG